MKLALFDNVKSLYSDVLSGFSCTDLLNRFDKVKPKELKSKGSVIRLGCCVKSTISIFLNSKPRGVDSKSKNKKKIKVTIGDETGDRGSKSKNGNGTSYNSCKFCDNGKKITIVTKLQPQVQQH